MLLLLACVKVSRLERFRPWRSRSQSWGGKRTFCVCVVSPSTHIISRSKAREVRKGNSRTRLHVFLEATIKWKNYSCSGMSYGFIQFSCFLSLTLLKTLIELWKFHFSYDGVEILSRLCLVFRDNSILIEKSSLIPGMELLLISFMCIGFDIFFLVCFQQIVVTSSPTSALMTQHTRRRIRSRLNFIILIYLLVFFLSFFLLLKLFIFFLLCIRARCEIFASIFLLLDFQNPFLRLCLGCFVGYQQSTKDRETGEKHKSRSFVIQFSGISREKRSAWN